MNVLTRLTRGSQATERFTTVSTPEAMLLMNLWTAANEVLAFHAPSVKRDAEITHPIWRLRQAVAALRDDDGNPGRPPAEQPERLS